VSRAVANPWVGINYLAENPRMAIPPSYWLQRLYDFDNQLVVFPSWYVPFAYVLARRRRMAGFADKALADTVGQPDTRYCLLHGLVPVCMIYRASGGGWSIDNIIASLKRRDIWAHGGGEQTADSEDQADNAERDRASTQTRNDMWDRSGQAWDSYRRRTGQRVSSPGMGSERHAPTAGSSGSTAGSGSVTLT